MRGASLAGATEGLSRGVSSRGGTVWSVCSFSPVDGACPSVSSGSNTLISMPAPPEDEAAKTACAVSAFSSTLCSTKLPPVCVAPAPASSPANSLNASRHTTSANTTTATPSRRWEPLMTRKRTISIPPPHKSTPGIEENTQNPSKPGRFWHIYGVALLPGFPVLFPANQNPARTLPGSALNYSQKWKNMKKAPEGRRKTTMAGKSYSASSGRKNRVAR